jgi:TRAP-type mannitol/chloroaromatic compound transport system substrate-binding protein
MAIFFQITHKQGRKTMNRRDFLKAGLTGASAIGLTTISTKALAKKPEFSFRLQSFLGPGWKEWEELIPRFIQRVNTMSAGRIEIKAYPPAALVATFDMLDAVGKGVVEIGYGAQFYWKGIFPFTEWTWGVPFALDVVDHYDYMWHEAGLTDIVREAFATKNVYFLGPVYSDEWGATMSTKPIKSLADFQGLKIRSFGIAAEIWKMNGAGIVRLPGEELYTGISTGVIDGVNWGSPYGMMATRLHEVAKYYCGPSLIQYDTEDMFINMDAWKSLPKDLQEVMVLATRVFALERASTSTMASCEAVGKMKEAGVTFTSLPDSDLEKMQKLTQELLAEKAKQDEYSAKVIGLVNKMSGIVDLRPRKKRRD